MPRVRGGQPSSAFRTVPVSGAIHIVRDASKTLKTDGFAPSREINCRGLKRALARAKRGKNHAD